MLKRASHRQSSFQNPANIFLLLAVPFCLIYAFFIIPAGAGFDEHCHIARAVSLLAGEYLFNPIIEPGTVEVVASTIKVPIDENVWDLAYGNNFYFQNWPDAGYLFPFWEDGRLISDLALTDSKTNELLLNALINNPLVYFPYCLGFALGNFFTTDVYSLIMWMRVFGIVFFCVGVYVSLRLIPVGGWPMLVLALTPNTLATACAVTADIMSIVACFLLVSIVVRMVCLDEGMTVKGGIGLAIASLFLAVAKVTYIPLLLIVWLLPLCNKSMRNAKALVTISIIFVVSSVIFILWYLNICEVNTGAMWKDEVDPAAQLEFMLADPMGYLKILFMALMGQDIFAFDTVGVSAYFDNLDYSGALLIILFALSFVCFKPEGFVKTQRAMPAPLAVMFLLLFFIITVLIFTALYLQFNEPAHTEIIGVQARYFAPILPVLVLPFAWFARDVVQSVGYDAAIVKRTNSLLAIFLAVNTIASLVFLLFAIY